jgi:hypothetical protein
MFKNKANLEPSKTKVQPWIGFWSALLMAAVNLWFYAAFLPYSSQWSAPWPGIGAYATSFQSGPFLAWIIPAFILPLVILIMMVSIHRTAEEDKRIWSLLGVVFAIAYTAVVTTFYYIQMTVIPFHLANGTMDNLSLWLFAYHYPHNIFGAIEGIGYGFLTISVIFAAQVFRNGKLQQWVRWTFVGLGIGVFALFINPLFILPPALGAIMGLVGLVLGILAPVLLAIHFRRSRYNLQNQDINKLP